MSSFIVFAADFYIQFDSSYFCYEEVEQYERYCLSGKVPLDYSGKIACQLQGGFGYPTYYTTIDIDVYEDDTALDDYLGGEWFSVHADTDYCDYAYFSSNDDDRCGYTTENLRDEISLTEGNNLEIYAYATGDDISTSDSDIRNVYIYDQGECQCFSGACCDLTDRPYTYKPDGSQPTGYTDEYTCSGDNTPVGTNWVYERDYYCDGDSSSAQTDYILVDTCGACEYCTTGDSTCNYYGSSTVCGIKDCDYLDNDCRDYHDEDKYCSSGSCISPSCNDYTNEPKHTSCGSGQECDGDGHCVTCEDNDYNYCYGLGEDLQTYFWDPLVQNRCGGFIDCHDNDVHWYDACDNRVEKQKECGEDWCDTTWDYYCKGDEIWRKKICLYKGCSYSQDYSNCYIDLEVVEDEYVETCPYECDGGQCIQHCAGTDTSCGTWPNCEDCNQQDGCYGDYRRNYYCDSNDRGCSYSSDNCNDCSCSCGNYDQPEADFCYDGKDNDCNGLTDGNDPACVCINECSQGQTRCNGNFLQTCGDYDADDCLEWPPSTSEPGNDDCSDCSCSCDDYNVDESLANENCDDGKDNDCDGQTDRDDPLCKPEPDPEVEWTYTFGGSDTDSAYSLAMTSQGGFIIAGYTESYFDGQGDWSGDYYLIKTDVNGNKLWEKRFGESSQREHAHSIGIASNGDYVIAGVNSGDVSLIRTDSNGNKIWEKPFGLSYNWPKHSLIVKEDGSYIIAGNKWNGQSHDVYLIKTDADGNKLWEKSFGGSDEDVAYSVAETNEGGYVIAGYTWSFGNHIQIYLIKTDANGNKLWEKTFGGSDPDKGSDVAVTDNGDYVIVGETLSYGNKGSDIYLIKTDSEGNKLWDKTFEFSESYYDRGHSVGITPSGDYIIAGETEGNKLYVIKTNSEGHTLWEITPYGTEFEEKNSLVVVSEYEYAITGAYNGDVYLIKLKVPCIDECLNGQTKCSGNYKQTCGNYDLDLCLEWPSSTIGDGNEYCPDGCDNGQCIICISHSYLSCYNNDVYWYDSCDNREELKEDCGSHRCDSGICIGDFNLDLRKGWNLFSLPMNSSKLGEALNLMKSHIINIFVYDSTSKDWELYTNTTDFESTTIPEENGMWLNLNNNYFSPATAELSDGRSYNLKQGLNLISYFAVDEEAIAHIFSNVMADINKIYSYEEGEWKTYIPGRSTNSLTNIKPGMGLWVEVKNDCVWNFKARDDNYFEKIS